MHTTIADQIKKCSTLKNLESLYTKMIKTNGNEDCFLVNQFITACTTFYRIDYGVLAFTQMKSPNVFVYNALLKSFVHCSHPVQALNYYNHMLKASIHPTSFTFSSLVKATSLTSVSSFGEGVHGHIWKHGFDSDIYVQTALLDYYSNKWKIFESRKVFDEMSERDSFVWTCMVSAYSRIGDLCSAMKLFNEMPEKKDIATWNTLIDGYARTGEMESAELLFNRMPKRDIISWTTMITCYSQNKKFIEALAVYTEMMTSSNDVTPDEVTITTVISCCAHLGALELGKSIHLYVLQSGFQLDVYIGSALVDMYAKCGSLDKSLLVFVKLREKNLFCWNSIIEGLAAHGYADEALVMFNKMEKEKIKPNGVTFISVLCACTHAGLVEEGRRRFTSMTLDYSITPAIEHYGCMIDLLSKAGLLDEALRLIRKMDIEPNAVVWGALLGGCKVHKNLEIAGIAVGELMVLEPSNSGYYTLLINMYAEVNRWGEVANIRTRMKELGVVKRCPGSSWVEIEGKVNQFSASDKFHVDADEIYTLLDELDGQLKLPSYVPDFGSIS